jgi:CDP-paratose 2-epimerase
VRDVLHVADLFDLLLLQMNSLSRWDGSVYNVGGGARVSLSLLELTVLCESVTGYRIPITAVPATSPVDLRIYLTDARKAQRDFGWRPARGCGTDRAGHSPVDRGTPSRVGFCLRLSEPLQGPGT